MRTGGEDKREVVEALEGEDVRTPGAPAGALRALSAAFGRSAGATRGLAAATGRPLPLHGPFVPPIPGREGI
jgi:hypothetical protein